jgi:hypothetical protein
LWKLLGFLSSLSLLQYIWRSWWTCCCSNFCISISLSRLAASAFATAIVCRVTRLFNEDNSCSSFSLTFKFLHYKKVFSLPWYLWLYNPYHIPALWIKLLIITNILLLLLLNQQWTSTAGWTTKFVGTSQWRILAGA